MGGFLKPWRRKIGVVTLLMACAIGAAWVRSLSVIDGISFATGIEMTESVVSAGGFVSLQTKCDRETVQTTFERNTIPLPDGFDGFNHPAMKWRWRCCGFGVGEIPAEVYDGAMITMRVIPYWSIVIPLTALSASLLLSKSRPATPCLSSPAH